MALAQPVDVGVRCGRGGPLIGLRQIVDVQAGHLVLGDVAQRKREVVVSGRPNFFFVSLVRGNVVSTRNIRRSRIDPMPSFSVEKVRFFSFAGWGVLIFYLALSDFNGLLFGFTEFYRRNLSPISVIIQGSIFKEKDLS